MTIIKNILILLLLLTTQSLYAKKNDPAAFLLQADDSTSFMHFEFHHLAYEAAQKKDFKNSYRIYQKLANKGDDRAEYNIGMLYMKGKGVHKRKMDGYKWLRRASNHGNVEAALYFKKLNDKYATEVHKKKKSTKKVKKEPLKKEIIEPMVEEVTVIQPAPRKEIIIPVVKKKQKVKESFPSNSVYVLAGFLLLIILGVLFLLKKGNKTKVETSSKKAPQNTSTYKAQLFDITYSYVKDYHTALLKHINLPQIKADKDKTQIYYMFINGAIDFYCQLEKLTDTQKRRIFTSHISEVEGAENLTAITQSILEGQRDSSMYHFQAAGGISAQAWHEHKSNDALSMFKKVLSEKRY